MGGEKIFFKEMEGGRELVGFIALEGPAYLFHSLLS